MSSCQVADSELQLNHDFRLISRSTSYLIFWFQRYFWSIRPVPIQFLKSLFLSAQSARRESFQAAEFQCEFEYSNCDTIIVDHFFRVNGRGWLREFRRLTKRDRFPEGNSQNRVALRGTYLRSRRLGAMPWRAEIRLVDSSTWTGFRERANALRKVDCLWKSLGVKFVLNWEAYRFRFKLLKFVGSQRFVYEGIVNVWSWNIPGG
jgi:hypothetical protein